MVSVTTPGASPEETEVTQTKNLSLGGVLITTGKSFDKGSNLNLDIHIFNSGHLSTISTRVIESREIVKNSIYETRLEFLDINEEQKKIISRLYRIKREK